MAERIQEFGGVSEEQLLFDRAVQLELGSNMKATIKCKVKELFEKPKGLAYRDSQIVSWNSLALKQARLTKCSVKDCFKAYTAKNGLKKHMAYNHIKQPDPSKTTKKGTVHDAEGYVNQQFDYACPVKDCFITYKARGRLRDHTIKAHKFTPSQVRQAGIL